MGLIAMEVVRVVHGALIIVPRSSGSPPVKKEKSEEREKVTPKAKIEKSPTKTERITPKEKKSPKSAKKSPNKRPKSNGKATEEDVDMKDVEADKPMNQFFLPKKEMQVQSVGAGLKGSGYNPDKTKYDPIKDAFWSHGEK